MKHFAYLLPVCCLLFAACRKDSPATEIIPTPRSVKAGQGTFDLGGGIRIAPADPLLRPAADYLAQLLREEDVAAAQDAGNANLSLELDPRLPQQGYTLKSPRRGSNCAAAPARASFRQRHHGASSCGAERDRCRHSKSTTPRASHGAASCSTSRATSSPRRRSCR